MNKVLATAEVINNGNQYTSEVSINQHDLLADEPIEKGGEDLGPAPGDYLCAALASCKAITLRTYAQRKKWKVEEIKVKVDLMKDNRNPAGQYTFVCELSFTGNLDEEQLRRLEVIANSCPLHKLLSKPNKIVTKLKQDNPL
jgi:putative redox protein